MKHAIIRRLTIFLASVALSLPLRAVDIFWADTSTNFNAAGSWTGGSPGSGNVSVFSDPSAAFQPSLTGNITVQGLRYAAGTDAWTLSRTSGANRTLTIGAAGILSSDDSLQTFTGSSLRIALGANQSFTSNSTGALFFDSSINQFNLGTRTLTLTGTSTNAANEVATVMSGTGAITKSGTGIWTLSANNTYTGVTRISGGTLSISDVANGGTASHIGSSTAAAGNLVLEGGGTLRFTGATDSTNRSFTLTAGQSGTIEVTGSLTSLTISGGSAATTGTLVKAGAGTLVLSGTNSHTGGTTVSAGTLQIGAGGTTGTLAGNITNNAGLTFNRSDALTYSGTISGTGSLTQAGAGTLTLSGTNTYTGATTFSAGTLSVATIGNGGVAGNLGQASSAASNLVFDGGTLRYTGSTASTDRGFTLNDGTTGTIDVAGAAANLTFSGSTTATTGALTKAGAGTLTLSGTNLHSGLTTVAAGTLVAGGNNALGNTAGNITVSAGGTLALAAGVNVTRSGTLTLNGTGASASTGALHAAGGTGTTSQWTGDITVGSASTITAADNLLIIGNGASGQFDTNTLTLNAGVTFHTPNAATVTPTYLPFPSYAMDPANIMVNSIITGTGGITKTGAGTLGIVRGSASVENSFTGDTVVTGGKLIVDGVSEKAVISSGNIFVGNQGSVSNDTVVLQMGQATGDPAPNNIIGVYNISTNASSSNLTIYEDGLFNMNRGSNGFANLTLQGGRVDGVGLNPLLTLTGSLTTLASAQVAQIDNANLGIGSNQMTMNVASGTAPGGVDLLVNARIQQGVGFTASPSGTTLVKAGAGTAVFAGDNTYGGITEVQSGVLNIRHANALGQDSGVLGSTDNGTVVAFGAQLQVQDGIALDNETLTINGTGLADTGALRSISGANAVNGIIYLGNNSRINADAGSTLTIANPNGPGSTVMDKLSGNDEDIIFGGAGNIIVNGGIAGGVDAVTKDGTGTLTLAGHNSYGNATTVNAGAVKVTHGNGLAGTGVTVASGAALQFAQDAGNNNIAVVGVGSTISGTGLSNGGAIQNLNGANSYLGAISLAANSRITANSGSSLTLSGDVSGGGSALDAGGAGNTTYSGVISGSGTTFTKTDAGTVTLSGSSANTFTGATSINDGTLVLDKSGGANAVVSTAINIGDGSGAANSAVLRLDTAEQIVNSASLVFSSDGRLDLNNLAETVGSIAGSGSILMGTGQLIAGGNDSSTAFSGTMTGTGLFQKEGTGSLTIASNLGYSGDINLNAGTLQFDVDNAFTGNMTILAGTTLRLTDADVSLNNLTFAGTGNVTIDFAGTSSTLNVLGTLAIGANVTITVRNWQDAADFWFAQNWTGAVHDTTGQSPMNRVTFDNNGSDPTFWNPNDTRWQSWDDQITPVPEPSTYGAILIGLSGAVLGLRRLGRRGRRRLWLRLLRLLSHRVGRSPA